MQPIITVAFSVVTMMYCGLWMNYLVRKYQNKICYADQKEMEDWLGI